MRYLGIILFVFSLVHLKAEIVCALKDDVLLEVEVSGVVYRMDMAPAFQPDTAPSEIFYFDANDELSGEHDGEGCSKTYTKTVIEDYLQLYFGRYYEKDRKGRKKGDILVQYCIYVIPESASPELLKPGGMKKWREFNLRLDTARSREEVGELIEERHVGDEVYVYHEGDCLISYNRYISIPVADNAYISVVFVLGDHLEVSEELTAFYDALVKQVESSISVERVK